MKKIFFYIVFSKFNNQKLIRLQNYLEYLKKIIPKSSKLIVLDLSKYYFGFNFDKRRKIQSQFNYLKINNFNDLKNICENKKVYGFGMLNHNVKQILLLILLKKFKIKLIGIMSNGYFPQAYNNIKLSLLYRAKLAILYRGNYYFLRILSLLNITPSIEYYFEASQNRINFLKRKKTNKIAFFKNVIRINSDLYSSNKKNKNKKKYITYIDSGYDHPDITQKEIVTSEEKRKFFYNNLFNFLEFTEKVLKKKLIYCKHPKAKYPKYFKRFEKRFIVKTGNAEKFIRQSYLVLLSVSTLLNNVFFLKRKIMIVGSQHWGNLVKDKIFSIRKDIKVPFVNIDNFEKLSKRNYESKIKFNSKIYENFIQYNLVYDRKLTHIEQMKKNLSQIT
ncbi:hypothetical protein ACIJYD_00725 [Candidatus Pelagibacter bacterium nBUS_33]|jgi:hypothetical protein|uniref:hypothetical protein n=1 Tax=Candidatus Pelagibacter bacterium nBUS_33 TaxID=3374193 RepID=UPI003EBACCD7